MIENRVDLNNWRSGISTWLIVTVIAFEECLMGVKICASLYSLKKAKPILVYCFIHVSEVVVVDLSSGLSATIVG